MFQELEKSYNNNNNDNSINDNWFPLKMTCAKEPLSNQTHAINKKILWVDLKSLIKDKHDGFMQCIS